MKRRTGEERRPGPSGRPRPSSRPRALLAALAGGTLGLLAACGEPPLPPPSALLVSLDTTRADRLGSYGRVAAGTPHLDALAGRGLRFSRAYTPTPLTLPAHTSLLTGLLPPEHGVRDNVHFRAGEELLTLTEVLGAAGFRTGGFVAGLPLQRRFGLAQGFEVFDDDLTGRPPMPERDAQATVEATLAWLEELEPEARFFAFVHLFDAHLPHAAPAAFAELHPRDPYQAEIAAMDAALGTLFEGLERLGRLRHTVLVVTGDHGEGLGEHREATHGFLLYEGTMRVPLLLAGPGVPRGRAVDEAARLIDVGPTLLDLLGVEGALAGTGRSLRGLWNGEEREPRPVFLETLYGHYHQGWSELHGLVFGPWKYLEAGDHPAELYDVLAEPGEFTDRAEQEPAVRDSLRDELRRLRASFPDRSLRDPDGTTPEELAQLALLGYSGAEPSEPEQAGAHPREMMGMLESLGEARARFGAGDLDASLALLDQLEATYGDNAAIERTRAHAYRAFAEEEPGYLDAAIKALRVAVERRPRHIYDQCDLAWLLLRAGHVSKALDRAQAAIRLDKEDVAARSAYLAALGAMIRSLEAQGADDPEIRARINALRARRRAFAGRSGGGS